MDYGRGKKRADLERFNKMVLTDNARFKRALAKF